MIASSQIFAISALFAIAGIVIVCGSFADYNIPELLAGSMALIPSFQAMVLIGWAWEDGDWRDA